MSKRPPLTTQAVEAESEAYRATYALFAADGGIDAAEQAVLDKQLHALHLAQKADIGRKQAIAFLDDGELSAWYRRLAREAEQLEPEESEATA